MARSLPYIARTTLQSSRAIAADPVLTAAIASEITGYPDYDGYAIDAASVRDAFKSVGTNDDVALLLADEGFWPEFLCRLEVSESDDYCEDDSDHDCFIEHRFVSMDATDVANSLTFLAILFESQGWTD
jgi:hypothetical protein